MHNLENLMGAVLAVKLFDPALHIVESDIQKLTTPLMRQEVVYQKKNLRIINDSCATSPDGTIVAIKRFIGEQQLVIILGGTNKDLKYNELAKLILKNFKQEDVVLLEGSATQQLVGELGKFSPRVCQTLSECVDYAVACASHKKGKTTILFSPGAASFEKFLHEFDRGAQFNKLIKKSLTS